MGIDYATDEVRMCVFVRTEAAAEAAVTKLLTKTHFEFVSTIQSIPTMMKMRLYRNLYESWYHLSSVFKREDEARG